MTDTPLREKPIVRRQRGMLRLKVLLQAAESLLAENDVSEVGLYQIAERAGVPAASIYHFFPNKEAALIALAEEYLQGFAQLATEPLDPAPRTWQELLERVMRRSAAHYDDHPALMKLFLGASISAEVRSRDMAGTSNVARLRAELFDRYFLMPLVKDWEDRLAVSIAIADGIWALSYNLHGRIVPDFLDESIRACTGYLRLFLPEYIGPQAPPITCPDCG